jgi:hypothetical protein
MDAEGEGVAEGTKLEIAVEAGGEGLLEFRADVEGGDGLGDHQRDDEKERDDDGEARDAMLGRGNGHAGMIVGEEILVIGRMWRGRVFHFSDEFLSRRSRRSRRKYKMNFLRALRVVVSFVIYSGGELKSPEVCACGCHAGQFWGK